MNDNKEEILRKMSLHIADELKEVRALKDKKAMIEKGGVLFNLNTIIDNYNELEPVLNRYLESKKHKGKNRER